VTSLTSTGERAKPQCRLRVNDRVANTFKEEKLCAPKNGKPQHGGERGFRNRRTRKSIAAPLVPLTWDTRIANSIQKAP
jgi:hypothetical protein